MFTYLAQASFLHRRNPTAKLLGLAIFAAGATLAFDPFIPGMLLLGLWLTTWLVGRVPLRQMLRWSLPILLLPIPLMILTALYADLSAYASPHILWHWGPWTLSAEGITTGIGLGLRVGTFIATSLLFIATTDPTDFAISLVQNLKVPYRFGYGVLVSFRFLPLLRAEFEIIRMAHKVRGVGERAGLGGRMKQMQHYAIPLLAAAIRKSERTALAMDAKAFNAGTGRTYFRQMRIDWGDMIFISAALLYVVGIYLVAQHYNLADLQWVPDV
jgi:energy-coupling factor transport system permease protein